MKPLTNRRIVVVEYRSEWSGMFAREKEALLAVVGQFPCVLDIQHVGSTSVLAQRFASNTEAYCCAKTDFITGAAVETPCKASLRRLYGEHFFFCGTMTTAELLAQRQLDAYNACDIESFLACYAPEVEIFDQPTGQRTLYGRDAMRERYAGFFANNPELHCRLLSRIAEGVFAIDHEHVTGLADGRELHAIAIYETNDEYITKVWFIRG